VWWDPNALALDAQQDVGLRQQRILEADESGDVAAEGIRAHERWQASRRDTLERGARPSVSVATVTALAAGAATDPDAAPVALVEVGGARTGRPHGRRFGILVHAVLAAIALDADAAGVARVAELQGRLVGAPDDEVGAASRAVSAALGHPLLQRAAERGRAGDLRRETPVLLDLADGTLAEGVVDLAFREPAGSGRRWTVIDFKTDREIEGHRAAYEAQVRLYVDAVARATGEPAQGTLLVV
jgi:ATP-dependent exoDNAse (exonuclease V) beta subunit